MATVPELHEAYRALLLRTCATGYKKDGADVDTDKIWSVFCQAAIQANEQVIEGKMSREELKASIQTFDLCVDAVNLIDDEIERLAAIEA